jgi:hypothetical protein
MGPLQRLRGRRARLTAARLLDARRRLHVRGRPRAVLPASGPGRALVGADATHRDHHPRRLSAATRTPPHGSRPAGAAPAAPTHARARSAPTLRVRRATALPMRRRCTSPAAPLPPPDSLRSVPCAALPLLRQALSASAPLIAVWDDHEITNDPWVGGAQDHVNRAARIELAWLAAAGSLQSVACGLQPVACSLWLAACGLRRVACGVRRAACGGVWLAACGVWQRVACGLRCG